MPVRKTNEKKLKSLEKERKTALEMAKEEDEKTKESTKDEGVKQNHGSMG